MKATVEMYEILTEQLRPVNKRGRVNKFAYIAKIGPVSKICASERSANKWLEKHGFRMNEKSEYILTHKPEFDLFIENHYKKVI